MQEVQANETTREAAGNVVRAQTVVEDVQAVLFQGCRFENDNNILNYFEMCIGLVKQLQRLEAELEESVKGSRARHNIKKQIIHVKVSLAMVTRVAKTGHENVDDVRRRCDESDSTAGLASATASDIVTS